MHQLVSFKTVQDITKFGKACISASDSSNTRPIYQGKIDGQVAIVYNVLVRSSFHPSRGYCWVWMYEKQRNKIDKSRGAGIVNKIIR